jgi:hypothetical protein
MITDNPGTSGNGHFEINIATALARTAHENWSMLIASLGHDAVVSG